MKKFLAVIFLLMVCVNSDAGLKAVSSGNTYIASNVAVAGGAINGTTVGASTPSTGAFTTLSATGTATLPTLSTTISIDSAATTNLVLKYNGVSTVTVGASGTPLTVAGLTTGTNADFLCLSAGGVVLVQTTACSISSRRFKTDISPYRENALRKISMLEPKTFRMKKGATENPDNNYLRLQVGLIAENVAKVDPKLAIYERDGITPKSYCQECVIAVAIKAIQEQQLQINALKSEIAALRAQRFVGYQP